ncbi:MAG: N-acetyltransferase [Bacteroidia bacterium]|nr:N-acetyltransferase [Bacteroidia bacterium]
MAVTVKRGLTRKDLRSFINFPVKLHKSMSGFVPSLFMDEMDTLDPKKNPAYEFCDVALFLAYKDGVLSGRAAAIVNHLANERWNHDEVRFGWFDFVDDIEVSKALLEAVKDFGLEHGMKTMTGPLGFTDFDPEGMLVAGFDRMSTMALHHNPPYYKDHMEALGFTKEIDWVEYRIIIPDKVPDQYVRVSGLVSEKYGLKVKKLTKREIRKTRIGYQLFDLINETYASLYNFTILPEKMIDKYVNFYLGVIDLDFVTVVVDSEDNPVGFGITMPSITGALKKCDGKLFPFGWFHLLKSMYLKHEDTVEMLLIGIKNEYRKKGVVSMIFADLTERFIKGGFKYAETNAELEFNYSVQTLWQDLEYEQEKVRRVYTKVIN